jgi:hypothetical protein
MSAVIRGSQAEDDAVEREIFSALRSPGCLDYLGNAYSFCADGSIRHVAATKLDGAGRFIARSSPWDTHAYLATSDSLYLSLHRQTALKIGPRADFLLRSETLPKYPSAFSADAGESSYFVWNGTEGTRWFSITADQVYDPKIALPITAFGGWADEEALVIVGRMLQPTSGTIRSAGGAAIASISSGASELLHTAHPLNSDFSSVDRWHGAFSAQGRRILIGASTGAEQTESWRKERMPTWHDSAAVMFCSLIDSEVECLDSVHEHGYVQLVRSSSSALVYLVYLGTHPGPRLRDLKVQAFHQTRYPSIRLETCEFAGLDPERVLLHVSLSHHRDTSFFGVVSLLRDTSTIEAFAVTSTDGVKWRVVAALY